ncbi:MAG: hypothetical protein HY716_04010 [Planctomycetes bacterium]|nr:hypothetical protein [Planctomycetota bacterium]
MNDGNKTAGGGPFEAGSAPATAAPKPKATAKADAAALPRLLLWKKDVASMLGIGGRTLERMISAGEIPSPDRRLRGRPAWLAATIREWVENGCPGAFRNIP